MDASERTVVKVDSPADILGVLPYRLGFHPTESIVVICLRGARRRDVLVMRLDLRPPDDDEAVAEDLVDRALKAEPSAVVLVCYTEAGEGGGGSLVREGLIASIEDGLALRGIEVMDALLVRGGRWRSYLCQDLACCPESGSVLQPELTAAARSFAAETVGQGGVLLRDRDELVRSIRPSGNSDTSSAGARGTEMAAQFLVAAVERGGVAGLRAAVLDTFANLLARWREGDLSLPVDTAATILLGLRDKRLRDEVITSMLDADPEVLLALLVALAAAAADDVAAPICTVLAWVAHSQGNGALANVAIERALDSDPTYELARLIEGGLDAMVSPAQVRRVAAQVRDDLRAEAPPRIVADRSTRT
jgi:hypothetical protein